MTVLTCSELSRIAAGLGGQLQFERDVPGERPVLDGEQQVQVLSEGLALYFGRSRDLVDGSSHHRLAAGITAAFLLDGEAEVGMPCQRLHFEARRGSRSAMLVNLTEADQFQRYWRSGRSETKVSVCIPADWLQQVALGTAFRTDKLLRFSLGHWQRLAWQPSADIVQRAHALFVPAVGACPLLLRLQRESFTLDLVSDVLHQIDAPVEPRLGARLAQCLSRLQEWLDSGEADGLTIGEMARQLGTNAVDLQRAFRARTGSTIAAYLRRQRLARAYRALNQQGVELEEVASLAGYEHLSSFSAAFKREYGVSPSQVRRCCRGSQ